MGAFLRLMLIASVGFADPLTTVEWTSFQGGARGFPSLRDLSQEAGASGDARGDRRTALVTRERPPRASKRDGVSSSLNRGMSIALSRGSTPARLVV